MLFSSPPPALYPFHINTDPIPTPYQRPLPYHPPATYNLNPGPSMDPATPDFRAFYPYTPNEVKHRKRTTSTQLKTLESIFRRDTKPNGPLRVELATKLGMTPRGVQVRLLCYLSYFHIQNRLYLGLVPKSVCNSQLSLSF